MTFQERLLALPALRDRLKKLTVESVASSFDQLALQEANADADWPYLLKCASVLAYSHLGKCQAAALRIAHACLSTRTTTPDQRAGAGVVLDTLTNYPALGLAIKKNLLDSEFKKKLPASLKFDAISRSIESSISYNDAIKLTRFQKNLFVALEDRKYVSVSAPTSAGKSFVLTQFVAQFISKNAHANVIYIVPTRALIQQCEDDFHIATSELSPKPIITSIPQLPEGWQENKCLFILTQERFHWILNNAPTSFNMDLLVVDEAQKVGDTTRGILLQQVIEEAMVRSPEVQVLFSSPMSGNPNILLKNFSIEEAGFVIDSDGVTVNQNLIWVSQNPGQPLNWKASLCIEDDNVALGEFVLPSRASVSKRLPFVAFALAGPSHGNLIYMNGQASAEKAAQQIWGLMGPAQETDDPEILELIKLVKKVVHKDYSLANVLTRRVAFHYGNMPHVIRAELERLFKEEKIHYLLCTSTLLEGVNLPAKSIFLRNPSRGRNIPLTALDFWNLAGRAGRLGKEFQGNVICVDPVDPNVWGDRPPRHRERYNIQFSFDKVMAKPEVLISYFGEGTPRETSRNNPEVEQAAVYLVRRYLSGHTLLTDDLTKRFPRETLVGFEANCRALIDAVEIPESIIRRNPGISPLAQQSLLVYFRGFERNSRELIPALPESPDAAKDSYQLIIKRINKYLSGGHSTPRDFYLAILVVNWMRGHSLARMIAANFAYWESKGGNLATVIRDTMRDIEEFARFQFVKYSSCYVDVLRLHFSQSGMENLISEIPDLNIWLEFGASQQTQISLISVGISRTAAIEIAEFIAQDNLTQAQCIDWLKSSNIGGMDLSPILMREIERMKAELIDREK